MAYFRHHSHTPHSEGQGCIVKMLFASIFGCVGFFLGGGFFLFCCCYFVVIGVFGCGCFVFVCVFVCVFINVLVYLFIYLFIHNPNAVKTR